MSTMPATQRLVLHCLAEKAAISNGGTPQKRSLSQSPATVRGIKIVV